jgi:virginiamycin B lyase
MRSKTEDLERIQLREDAKDPHTLIFDKDENRIWFSIQHSNMVGSMDIATRELRYTKPYSVEASRPYGIEEAPDGKLWIAHFGTNMISEVDPETMAVTEYKMPAEDARPRRITVLSNGDVYYGDFARSTLGLVRSGEGFVKEWAFPKGDIEAEPYLVLSDSNDIVWSTVHDSKTNFFVGFDPRVEAFVSISPVKSAPKGQGHIRHGHYHEETGSIWFGSDSGTIGQAVVDK